MKKFLKIAGGILLLLVVIGIWLVGFNGYMPWTYRVSHAQPEIVGTRQNAQGIVVQKIYRQISSTSVDALFTPEGPRRAVKSKIEFFLQPQETAMVPLLFLSDTNFHYFQRLENNTQSDLQFCDKFLPVTNSPLWIAAGTDPVNNFTGGYDFHVLVFDESHLVSWHTFSLKIDYEHPGEQFQFANGNRILKVNTSLGFPQKYDVLNDSVTDLR